MALSVIHRAGHDPAANLSYEESLFNALRDDPRPICLFYVNDPCVVAGSNNRLEEWVNMEAARANAIPVLRRFTGGGTVYHDRHTLNFSFIAPKNLIGGPEEHEGTVAGPSRYIAFFRGIVIRALKRGGDGYAQTRKNDISLNGRKVSGGAQRIARSIVLHHGTLLRRCPIEAIERYLPLPPDRRDMAHRDFLTGLYEEGREHAEETLREWIASEFAVALAALGEHGVHANDSAR